MNMLYVIKYQILKYDEIWNSNQMNIDPALSSLWLDRTSFMPL